ncbi:DgyrCDS7475 [Dimorphilus gyrociliatus]|uniref:TIMELESS-interacting protein n=1 Tax=Dimorphilus gyrociliatus TaxID=2664684 RepID=A0A7I8VS38_9ANNE|nr:DgyrCDS7475 [Dimorphilus gyrociliatus]
MEEEETGLNDLFGQDNKDDDGLKPLDDNENNEGQSKDEKKESKAKRVINPQPKLDGQRLGTSRGLSALPDLAKSMNFRGKGNEINDIRYLMMQMEHWAHRLFPKLTFEDFINRMEKLGGKSEIKSCIRRIRSGIISPEEGDNNNSDGDSNHGDTGDSSNQFAEFPRYDETDTVRRGFDNMESDQDVNDKIHDPFKPTIDADHNSLKSSVDTNNDPLKFSMDTSSDPFQSSMDIEANENKAETKPMVLTEEQKRKIQEKREKALKLRNALANSIV